MPKGFFNRLTSPLDILMNRGNPVPRMSASISSWTKCKGSCQPHRPDTPRNLACWSSQCMWGRAGPTWCSRTREIYPRSIHAGAREPTVRSGGSPCESRCPAPPGSPACSSPPTPERPPAPQTRAGEARWGLRISSGCSSSPLGLPKEILRLWASG